MDPSPPRRRPTSAAPERTRDDRAPSPRIAGLRAGPVVAAGAVLVVVVIAIAFATGTADDLPWGAIAGVVVLLGATVLAARRRARSMRDAFPDEDDNGRP